MADAASVGRNAVLTAGEDLGVVAVAEECSSFEVAREGRLDAALSAGGEEVVQI